MPMAQQPLQQPMFQQQQQQLQPQQHFLQPQQQLSPNLMQVPGTRDLTKMKNTEKNPNFL
jgi:hypothetical protein